MSNTTEIKIHHDEDIQLINKIKKEGASIDALDLHSNTEISTITIRINSKDIKNKDENKEEYKEEYELPPKGLLKRAHSLDSGKEKIVNVPSIEEIKSLSTKVIVPSRDVLIKMPFYSTPLTIESTNNAFRDFMIRLNEMGFEQQSEAALIATNAESVEAAIEFIMNNPDQLYHRFISNDNILCIKCGLTKIEHIIDSNGKLLIDKEKEEQNNNLLQNIIDERVKNILEIEIKQEEEEEEEKEEEVKKEEEEEEIIEYSGPTETCLICFDDRPLTMFYRASCGHNYCKICLETHYKIKTKDGDVLKLSCIDPKCNREIEENEILNFLIDKELRDKFIKFKKNKLLMLNPNARFCCKPGCEGTMIGSRITKRKLICPICSTSICFNCNQPWHGLFVGCNKNVDIGYTKWALNKDVSKCPKCRMAIEKDEGCNHMTCSSCNYEFCWICKGPYNDHHFEWWNIFGCPGAQYTPRFCRCPYCFPRWLNRILIILCFLSIVIPIIIIAAIFWLIIVCLIFCIRCDFKCDNSFLP